MGIDLSRFKVIHGDKVLNAVALMEVRMPEGTWENRETIVKPKILEILAINEDGNIVSIMDEAWMFQFLPIVSNQHLAADCQVSEKAGNMIITGMKHFESVCKRKLVDWYNCDVETKGTRIDLDDVYIVWACKTLQNYKCLASTSVSGDGIYAEFTYNGDKQELYEDVYKKLTNTCHREEQLN